MVLNILLVQPNILKHSCFCHAAPVAPPVISIGIPNPKNPAIPPVSDTFNQAELIKEINRLTAKQNVNKNVSHPTFTCMIRSVN